MKLGNKKNAFKYVFHFFLLFILNSCGESQPPEISSFLKQDTGELKNFECKDFKKTEFSYEEYNDLLFEETPSIQLYKYNTVSGNKEIHVFGPIQSKLNGEKVSELDNNFYMLNRYKSRDGFKWSQFGKTEIYKRTIDSDTGKVISYEEDVEAALSMAFMKVALLASTDLNLQNCVREEFRNLGERF